MIKSMTGYGCAKGKSGSYELSIELRSVNNRYLDCSIRIPRVYTAAEDALKALVSRYISRGKVDVFITVDTSKANDVAISINKPLADAYMSALKALSDEYGLNGSISVTELTRFPDILQMEKSETDTDQLTADLCAVLEEALRGFDEMRYREGAKLADDISSRLDEIERLTALVEELSPKSVSEYRAKLEARMAEVLSNTEIDEARILIEAAIFADRVAVNEETVRLKSHVGQLRIMLKSRDAVGRKLDFLIQELNREANTIGSKGNDVAMARTVVDLKAEIEKIREQAQNIE
jgi:uncharacterized protein (TIGR00255 family)